MALWFHIAVPIPLPRTYPTTIIYPVSIPLTIIYPVPIHYHNIPNSCFSGLAFDFCELNKELWLVVTHNNVMYGCPC